MVEIQWVVSVTKKASEDVCEKIKWNTVGILIHIVENNGKTLQGFKRVIGFPFEKMNLAAWRREDRADWKVYKAFPGWSVYSFLQPNDHGTLQNGLVNSSGEGHVVHVSKIYLHIVSVARA